MDSFNDIKKLFDFDVDSILDDIFEMNRISEKVIEFNQEQLLEGRDALNQSIVTIGGSPYRPYTAKIRESIGLPTDRVTLRFRGDFYKTFEVVMVSEGYEIKADFRKDNGSILDNFTSEYDFLGLDDSSLTELVMEFIYPLLSKMIRSNIGL